MTNLILFFNTFLSYLLVFVIIVALVIIACILGVKWRKSSDAKKNGSVDDTVVPDMVEVEKQQ